MLSVPQAQLASQAIAEAERAAHRVVPSSLSLPMACGLLGIFSQILSTIDRIVEAWRKREAELVAKVTAEAKRLQQEYQQVTQRASQAVSLCEEAKRLSAASDLELLQRVGAVTEQLKVDLAFIERVSAIC